ncbi:hypothetical protein SHO565_52740 [Streptomyces sp. HO565]
MLEEQEAGHGRRQGADHPDRDQPLRALGHKPRRCARWEAMSKTRLVTQGSDRHRDQDRVERMAVGAGERGTDRTLRLEP